MGSQYSSCGAHGLGGDFLRGDMGVSLLYRQPVSRVIAVKLSNSLWLMAWPGWCQAWWEFCSALWPGPTRGRTVDRVISSYALITASTPAFWLSPGAADGVCGVAEGVAHRAFRTHRRGGVRG